MNKPIGVFDSGIGGLTVLEAVYKLLPTENYIYLADFKNNPYGVKSVEEVETIVVNNALLLEKMGAKLIIIACNTASLYAESIKKAVRIPVIEVIEKTCENACNASKNAKIGVIATQMTIEKGKYQSLINKENKHAYGVKCSEFVDYIEHKFDDYDLGMKLVKEKINSLKEEKIDTLIYGCTHFSLLEDKIKTVLGDINYVDCGNSIAPFVKEELVKNGLINHQSEAGKIIAYTTKDAQGFREKLSLFNLKIESVEEIK